MLIEMSLIYKLKMMSQSYQALQQDDTDRRSRRSCLLQSSAEELFIEKNRFVCGFSINFQSLIFLAMLIYQRALSRACTAIQLFIEKQFFRQRHGSAAKATVISRSMMIVLLLQIDFNGMINLTFASLKNAKDVTSIKQQIAKKQEPLLPSFKALGEAKENQKLLFQSKRLDNQENTLSNATNTYCHQFPRKNIVKVDKSSKKANSKQMVYKSPTHRNWEGQSKALQQSNYCPKSMTHRQNQPLVAMTPCLVKNTSSLAGEQLCNNSFLTQKQRTITNSEQGSISSCTNSFNDSFQLTSSNMEEQERSHRDNFSVLNSLEMKSPNVPKDVNAECHESELKTMKKSIHFFCNNESMAKDFDQKSISSVASSFASMKFSEKFKHYKKKPTNVDEKTQRSGFALRDFKLIHEIGTGKYGKVYLAMHQRTGFVCALKMVSKKVIKEEQLEIPFMREVKIQLYLNHPNIVKLFGLFHDSDNVYLIMEYCSGSHLYKVIKQHKQFTEGQILQVLNNLFEAVSYIHCNGVIHRDIKPENVVIEHGAYKLCDFGWAAYACGDTRTTFCGTPLYVCPEVLKGEEYNQKADVWGLGVVTYQLTFGRVPFSIMSQSDLAKIIKDPVYFPMWGQVSEKLVSLVRRMLSKHSSQRPSLNQILSSELFVHFRQSFSSVLKRQLQGLY